ncbi:protein of unknown function [Hyphomicrobium sp. MC1]|nr:protein of unknown function [Hyphomicrobium sp. MC1]
MANYHQYSKFGWPVFMAIMEIFFPCEVGPDSVPLSRRNLEQYGYSVYVSHSPIVRKSR